MGSSTGDFCKVVKVVTTAQPSLNAPSSTPPAKALKAIHSPVTTTRLMSIPEFEGKLEKLKGMHSQTKSEEETDLKTNLLSVFQERVRDLK